MNQSIAKLVKHLPYTEKSSVQIGLPWCLTASLKNKNFTIMDLKTHNKLKQIILPPEYGRQKRKKEQQIKYRKGTLKKKWNKPFKHQAAEFSTRTFCIMI